MEHAVPLVARGLARPPAEPRRGLRGDGLAAGALVRGDEDEGDGLAREVLGIVPRQVRDVERDAVARAQGARELVREPARGARLRAEEDLAADDRGGGGLGGVGGVGGRRRARGGGRGGGGGGAIETAVAREEEASETTARRAGSVATPSPPADAREWDPPMATERATRRRPSES